MSSSTSRYNKIIREKSVKLLNELYSSKNTGKGTRITISKYLNKGNPLDGILEKIVKREEKFEVFFKVVGNFSNINIINFDVLGNMGYFDGYTFENFSSLAGLNDNGYTFEQIAKLIELYF